MRGIIGRGVLFAAVCCILVLSCSRDTPFDPHVSAKISGRVRDSSGRGIGGATVTLSGDDDVTSTAVTDAEGRYFFTAVDDGMYFVSCESGDREFTITTNEILVDGETVIPDFISPSDIVFVSIPPLTKPYTMNFGGRGDFRVTLSGYEMSVTEVTNHQYVQFLNSALAAGVIMLVDYRVRGVAGEWRDMEFIEIPWMEAENYPIYFADSRFRIKEGMDNRPVTHVTWYGAKAFAAYYGYDLPTEAEWQYAASGGKNHEFGTGDGTLDGTTAAYGASYLTLPVDVGGYPPNPFGLYDMAGNVWECCHDFYGDYPAGTVHDYTGPPEYTGSGSSDSFVRRGGNISAPAEHCRNDYRDGYSRFTKDLGFRVVRRPSGILSNTSAISGRVDADGAGLEGVTVNAGDLFTVTGHDGTYAFAGMSDGLYILSFTRHGYRFTPETIRVAVDGENVTVQRVSAERTEGGTYYDRAGIAFVSVPGGTFRMGDIAGVGHPDELPVHTVSLTPFEMSACEITRELYSSVMGENPSMVAGRNTPIDSVTWYDAARFCNRLSEQEGFEPCYDEVTWDCDFTADGFRLPTEAEWEYACRAGTETLYYTGDTAHDAQRAGWFDYSTHTVGTKFPNPWGLYDMHGNVREWCNDRLDGDYYKVSPEKDPTGPDSGNWRICRGGSWRDPGSHSRSAYRGREMPERADEEIGFRIVRRN